MNKKMPGNNVFYQTYYASPIGDLTLVGDGINLVGLWIGCQQRLGSITNITAIEKGDFEIFDSTKRWLNSYFKGDRPSINELALAPIGNEFRQSVWKLLCEIPYGSTVTYGDIAKRIAQQNGIPKMSAQAIGGVVSHNPILIIIPCHRVIGANGALTGYSGGISTKMKLLQHERGI